MQSHTARSAIFVSCLALVSAPSFAELVTFTNTNPELDRLSYFQSSGGVSVLGQSLDVTRGAFDQPGIGEMPSGSLLIAWFEGITPELGDWIYMAPGMSSAIVRAESPTLVTDPITDHPVGHYGPADMEGLEIGSSSAWVADWHALHAINEHHEPGGVDFTDASFTVGIRFLIEGETHFGFASFTRSGFDPEDPLSISFRPTRWGYETRAGVAVPSPGVLGVIGGLGGLGGCVIGRRRRC